MLGLDLLSTDYNDNVVSPADRLQGTLDLFDPSDIGRGTAAWMGDLSDKPLVYRYDFIPDEMEHQLTQAA